MSSGNLPKRIWVDAEVHLFPDEWCEPGWRPPEEETVLNRVVYDHLERDRALAGATATGLIREMDRAGIDKAVIMGLPWKSPGLCDQNNAAVAEAQQSYPDRLIGIGVLPSPERVDPLHALLRIQDIHQLHGVKVIPSWQGWKLDDERMDPLYAEMAKRGLVLVPHTDHAYLPDEGNDPPHRLMAVAERFPELKILAPHLGGLLSAYGLYDSLKDKLRNILFVGTVPKTMPMIRWAVEAAGASQVAFGTDFPFNPSHEQGRMKQQVAEMGFTESELDSIAGANVLKFFGVGL